ncbi:MAG TPA: AsmA family protein [Steroidobacteraceae bacterium]|jgi:hypothetical protein|nr:AsmA family protein [Steroidobacteraceae bacterium]
MKGKVLLRRGLFWGGLTALAAAGLVLLCAAVLDAGYLHGPLVRLIARRAQRPVHIDGPIRVRLLSRNPRLVAGQVTIGNPPWVPAGVMAKIGKITLVLATPRIGRETIIESLELDAAELHLLRDGSGHANWQLENPDLGAPKGLPIIHSLSMRAAQVELDDAQKHRRFAGTVSVQGDGGVSSQPHPLRIAGKGQLNGRAMDFELSGDPLRSASQDKRYDFSFSERSSGSHLVGSGFLLHPFDVHVFDATFDVSGADLKDMYYLTGANLIDTGSYRVTGKLRRRGYTSFFSELAVTSGQSDVRGSASIDTTHGRTRIDADLNSQRIVVSDLGLSAAGREPESKPDPGRLLSDVAPDPSGVRRSVANVKFRAKRIEAGRVSLSAVAANLTDDHGVLAAPLAAELLGGKMNAQIRIDAAKEIPTARLELKIDDLQLGQFVRKKSGPPPVEGSLSVRASFTGRGKSLHEMAASAGGTVTARMPGGMLRASLAELTGIDLRGFGLLLAKNKEEVPIRCAVANFQAHDGTLAAKTLVLDTEPMLIAGEGFIHLDTETLDLALRGYPKNVRFLQLRAPISIRGTLKAPSIGIQAHASKLVLVDPGKAKNADCGSLLQ